MQIKLNSKKELELFYIGLMLGKELLVVEEWTNHECVGFGDFEGLNIVLSKQHMSLDFDYTDNRERYFAAIGVVHEARREVNEWLGGENEVSE